jgi:hypothetical protein
LFLFKGKISPGYSLETLGARLMPVILATWKADIWRITV